MKKLSLNVIAALVFTCMIPAVGYGDCAEYSFIKIVDTATPVPGGDGGPFESSEISLPAMSNRKAAFRGEGGGVVGLFVGDGRNLNIVVAEGDPLSAGNSIVTLYADFAFDRAFLNFIASASSGLRGIYSTAGAGNSKIVEFGDPAPLPSGGTFSTIFFISREVSNLAFQASVTGGLATSGVYARIADTNQLVADTNTVIPGTAATTFGGGSFSDPDIFGQDVVFKGGFGGLTGVYARIAGDLIKVADTNDTQPGSIQLFKTFSIPVISSQKIAFRGVGGFAGIYTGGKEPLTAIVKTGDPAPGGSTFAGFGQYVAIDGHEVAFSGSGSGFNGLFVHSPSGSCRIIDTGDTLDGKDITQLEIGRDSYSRGYLAFRVRFADGSRAIYMAKLDKGAQIVPTAVQLLLLNKSEK